MHLPPFAYHKPASLGDACRILSESPDAAVLAGGTDLLVEMKQGLRAHRDIVSLNAIPELRSITADDAALSIGAAARHNVIRDSDTIRRTFPALAEAAGLIGTDQVRNSGTIGGNLCTGASCSDMAPILMALNAAVELSDGTATRVLPVEEFFVSHRGTRMRRDEVMTRIIVPRNGDAIAARYEKFGLRAAASIAVASAAAALTIRDGVCVSARIVVGAVAPTPRISHAASTILTGIPVAFIAEDARLVREAGDAAAGDALPIDDIRGSAGYRRALVRVLTRRAVRGALAQDAARGQRAWRPRGTSTDTMNDRASL